MTMGPDVLRYEEAPRPTARPGELLIRVHATTVNPIDCEVRAGYLHSYFNYKFPYGKHFLKSPTFLKARPCSSMRPPVGWATSQLAKLHGAKVIGTSSLHLDFLNELGVDQAIDYATTAFEDVVSDVDIVLDLMGGETQQRSWKVLKRGGILISTVQLPSEETALAHSVRQGFVDSAPPIGKTLTEVAALVDNGQLKPVVSTVLSLEDIQKAHQIVEGRHMKGKLVLQVQD